MSELLKRHSNWIVKKDIYIDLVVSILNDYAEENDESAEELAEEVLDRIKESNNTDSESQDRTLG